MLLWKKYIFCRKFANMRKCDVFCRGNNSFYDPIFAAGLTGVGAWDTRLSKKTLSWVAMWFKMLERLTKKYYWAMYSMHVLTLKVQTGRVCCKVRSQPPKAPPSHCCLNLLHQRRGMSALCAVVSTLSTPGFHFQGSMRFLVCQVWSPDSCPSSSISEELEWCLTHHQPACSKMNIHSRRCYSHQLIWARSKGDCLGVGHKCPPHVRGRSLQASHSRSIQKCSQNSSDLQQ